VPNNNLVPVSEGSGGKGRRLAPDNLRILACFFVISIHFFYNSDYYSQPLKGAGMILMLIWRVVLTTCVPLFVILTGYLMSTKPLSGKHYAKGMKVIWLYLLASLAVLIYRVYINHELLILSDAIWGILRYNTAPYAWYVEMYIGLYLLIPFLNILYQNIPSKRWKIALIITLACLSMMPYLINYNNYKSFYWWLHPSVSNDVQKIIPQWWCFGYPLVYYFIGAYLREYGLPFKKNTQRLMLAASIALQTLYCLWRADGGKFPGGAWTGWEWPLNAVNATLIASLMLDKEYNNVPEKLAKALSYISSLTLQLFLVSYIFDNLFYPILMEKLPTFPERLWGYFVIVPAVFLCSLALSVVIDLIYRLFALLYGKIKQSIIAKKKPDTV